MSKVPDVTNFYTGVGARAQSEDDYMSTSLELFAPVPRDDSVIHSQEHEVAAITDVTAGRGPYRFNLPYENPRAYLKMSSLRLHGQIRIMIREQGKTAWANLTTEQAGKVGLVNDFVGALWDTINIQINHRVVPKLTTTLAGYKSYIVKLLSYDKNAVPGRLYGALFREPNKGDSFNTHKKPNEDIDLTKTFEFITDVESEIAHLDRHLPPGLPVQLVLTRGSDEFAMMKDSTLNGDLRIDIIDMKVLVRTETIDEKLHQELSKKLETGAQFAHYPYVKTNPHVHIMGVGSQYYYNMNLISGELPQMLIVFMVDSRNFIGSDLLDPYFIAPKEHNLATGTPSEIKSMWLTINSRIFPLNKFKVDFTGKNTTDTYTRAMMENLNVSNNMQHMISKALWDTNCNIYPFDLTPAIQASTINPSLDSDTSHGRLGFHCEFTKPTNTSQTFVFLAFYNETLCVTGPFRERKIGFYEPITQQVHEF